MKKIITITIEVENPVSEEIDHDVASWIKIENSGYHTVNQTAFSNVKLVSEKD